MLLFSNATSICASTASTLLVYLSLYICAHQFLWTAAHLLTVKIQIRKMTGPRNPLFLNTVPYWPELLLIYLREAYSLGTVIGRWYKLYQRPGHCQTGTDAAVL